MLFKNIKIKRNKECYRLPFGENHDTNDGITTTDEEISILHVVPVVDFLVRVNTVVQFCVVEVTLK